MLSSIVQEKIGDKRLEDNPKIIVFMRSAKEYRKRRTLPEARMAFRQNRGRFKISKTDANSMKQNDMRRFYGTVNDVWRKTPLLLVMYNDPEDN